MGRQALKLRRRERKAGCRRGCLKFFLLVLLIVIAFIFLWPVDKRKATKSYHYNRSSKVPLPAAPGEKTIGRTAYHVFSAASIKNLPGFTQASRATPVAVSFSLRNLARFGRAPNKSMFAIVDDNDNSYVVNEDMTFAWYQWQKRASLWDKTIAPGQLRRLTAVFAIPKGPPKAYSLVVQDIDWRSTKKVNLPVGKISTR